MLQQILLLPASDFSRKLRKTSLNMKAESPWDLPVLCISRQLAISQKTETFIRTVWYPFRSIPWHETWSLDPGTLFKRVLWMPRVNTTLRKDKYMKTVLWNGRCCGRFYATMPEYSLEVSGEPQKFV